jgi:hypothetical protein
MWGWKGYVSSPGCWSVGYGPACERGWPMVGLLFFLVVAGLAIRVHYGLRCPHFWVFSGLVVLIGLPLTLLMMVLGGVLHL